MKFIPSFLYLAVFPFYIRNSFHSHKNSIPSLICLTLVPLSIAFMTIRALFRPFIVLHWLNFRPEIHAYQSSIQSSVCLTLAQFCTQIYFMAIRDLISLKFCFTLVLLPATIAFMSIRALCVPHWPNSIAKSFSMPIEALFSLRLALAQFYMKIYIRAPFCPFFVLC